MSTSGGSSGGGPASPDLVALPETIPADGAIGYVAGLYATLTGGSDLAGVLLTDDLALAGSGNGVAWHRGASDGTQELVITTGPGGDNQSTFDDAGDLYLSNYLYANGVATLAIASGALPTKSPSTGVGLQIDTLRDVNTHTQINFTATGGTCAIALSPDGTTYTTVATLKADVAAGQMDAAVLVPAAWYLKLTVSSATIGTLYYY